MITVNADQRIKITINEETMNLYNCDQILKELKNAANVNTGKDIDIDMQKVKYIDSSSIAMLVNFMQSLSGSKRKMSVINASTQIKTTIQALNLTSFLNLR